MVKTSGGLLALSLLSASLIGGGCVSTPRSHGVAAAQLEAEVRSFEAAVFSAYNGDDPARAATFYANDAFVFVPDQPHTKGREAIAANIARYMQDPHFALGYVNELTHVSASGDLAYTRGKLTVTYTDRRTKAARTIKSSYLLVMRREPSAVWQVVEDISF